MAKSKLELNFYSDVDPDPWVNDGYWGIRFVEGNHEASWHGGTNDVKRVIELRDQLNDIIEQLGGESDANGREQDGDAEEIREKEATA